jgi:hypothetical protein
MPVSGTSHAGAGRGDLRRSATAPHLDIPFLAGASRGLDGSPGHARCLAPGMSRGAVPSDPGPTIAIIPDREVAAMASRREALDLLLIEEADAWFEYLEATRGQSRTRYQEVEPWAWSRLSQRLRAIRTRRAKLRPAAA